MILRPCVFYLSGLVLLLGGCFQAELNGPVSGARITISELRDATAIHLRVRANSRQSLVESQGRKKWDSYSRERKLWLLGVFAPELSQLQDDRLYLVTASGGRDADLDRDGREDEQYTPVAGSWRAIMSGAQLKSRGPRVSALTESLYLWLERDLDELSDARVLYNLDRAAVALVADVDESGAVSGTDLLHWNRLFAADKFLGDSEALDRVTSNLVAGGPDGERRAAALDLITLAVDRDTPEAKYLPQVLALQLAGLSLADFFDVSYRWLLRRSPETVVELGLESRYGHRPPLLDTVSDDYEETTDELVKVILAALRDIDRSALSGADRVSYDIYRWFLEDELAAAGFRLFSYPASSFITGVPSRTRFFFTDIHPLATPRDATDYLARLRQVDEKFGQLRAKVATRAGVGIIEPAITLDWGLDALRSVSNTRATSTDYYRRFDRALGKIPGLSAARRDQLRDEARAIIENQLQPAYAGLIADLEGLRQRAPDAIGMGQFEGGDAFYAWALRHHTTSGMSAAEVHQLGLDELQRIHAEIREVAAELGYSSRLDLVELFEQIAVDGGVLAGGEILATYRALVEEANDRLPEAFDVLPSQQVVVIGGPSGGFYVSGSEDGSRPGAFYAATQGQEARFIMPSLSYHEAVPGHHLQIALAQEQALPEFRRYINYTAFVEGWALYAERLAYELGWYALDPYGNLGRLQFEAIRAARLVVDTGIHDRGWSWNRAVDFYRRNTGETLRFSEGAVGRFLRWPGQATSYMIGMNRFLALRAQMQQAQGSDFDLRAFHRLILTGAAMPMDILQQVVTANLAGPDNAKPR